ncbi:MAG: type I CRISPR-associated protein Cas7 [Deltaproteobacteria bacterium]|nr:type I CRISPR-associated protein Cas7 [Deltaproteobacteria bacterium]
MIHLDPTKRHDFVILFDVENANPNGDPDAGNLPRVDPETMRGFTTDVSIKRKVRDYLQLTCGIPMFIQSETALNRLIFEAAEEAGAALPSVTLGSSKADKLLMEFFRQKEEIENLEIDEDKVRYVGESFKKKEIRDALKSDTIKLTDEEVKSVSDALIESDDPDFKDKAPEKKDIESALRELADKLFESVGNKKGKLDKDDRDNTRIRMIEKYFDIRMFGAVLSTGLNAGQVRGPAQLTFTKSLDPIYRVDCGITRKAVTKEADRKRKENEMGRKPIVSYGLYQGFGFYNPYLAQKTPKPELTLDNLFVSKGDLENLWEALWKGFDNDHSASRHLRPRGVYVFTHSNARGNAPSHRLFEMLKIKLKEELQQQERSPSQFCDYDMTLPAASLQVGSASIQIKCAENISDTSALPENTVVFTKIYHED